MYRRELIGKGVSALVLAAVPRSVQAHPDVLASAGKTAIAISSANLHWLRIPEEIAEAAIEMGFGAITLTVGPPPAHVSLADAPLSLAAFVHGLRGAGIVVDTISCSADLSPDVAGIDALLAAASKLDIKQYIFGPYPYAADQSIPMQLDTFKPSFSALARLNTRYGIRGLYRNRAGLYLGAALFDLVEVLRGIDRSAIGICYDTGQGALAGGNNSWKAGLLVAGPYLGGLFCTDYALQFQLDANQGGVFTGTSEDLATSFKGGVTRPFGGGGGQTNPWIAPAVPLGTGLVDLPQLATILRKVGFEGPLTVLSDYPNGGTENGGDKLTLPRALVLGAIKRDLLTLKAGLAIGDPI
jgi:sugar phosphate isomerase/epimerase